MRDRNRAMENCLFMVHQPDEEARRIERIMRQRALVRNTMDFLKILAGLGIVLALLFW